MKRYETLMTDDQMRVLDILIDDHYAFWDFADQFPTMRPDASNNQVIALVELVRAGLIQITFGNWFENETTLVESEEAEAALIEPASWDSTGREPGYVLELTKSGSDFLRERGIGPPV